jgi:hypothetical protein
LSDSARHLSDVEHVNKRDTGTDQLTLPLTRRAQNITAAVKCRLSEMSDACAEVSEVPPKSGAQRWKVGPLPRLKAGSRGVKIAQTIIVRPCSDYPIVKFTGSNFSSDLIGPKRKQDHVSVSGLRLVSSFVSRLFYVILYALLPIKGLLM